MNQQVNPPTPPPYTDCGADGRELAKLGNDDSLSVRLDGTKWFPFELPPDKGNDVQWFIYGRCAFDAIATALATVTSADHRIYLIGWYAHLEAPLGIGGPTVKDALAAADGRHVPIRVMLYKNRAPGYDTEPFVTFVNGLTYGTAVWDQRVPDFGAHHQKLLVVQGEQGLVAFAGGMDLFEDREWWNYPELWPLHDVHLQLTGPAARTVLNIFYERWRDHPDTPPLDRKGNLDSFPMGLPEVALLGGNTRQLVRVGRTYPNAAKHGMTDAQGQPASYQFAPTGEMTAWRLIEHAIGAAIHFIYLEDQYLVSRRVSQALAAQLASRPHFEVVILTSRSDQVIEEISEVVPRRKAFAADLKAADPTGLRWSIHCLVKQPNPERAKWCGPYVHSKTWIFDDLFFITGSANVNERGYSHDSEAVVGVADDVGITRGDPRSSAQLLRIALWHKHLGIAHRSLVSWQQGIRFWRHPPPTAMVTPFDLAEADPNNLNTADPQYDILWNTVIDPSGT
ncbi:MAG TPA: phospholipase D family protein [Streptosporangiaceae bacterium]|jgi:phosphatidylserine/phosphatidylglycerophosphate/cardiolipin synthase-like enzyme|nr:phospholipase D family protein [Streptosporangiaceae bacterium]